MSRIWNSPGEIVLLLVRNETSHQDPPGDEQKSHLRPTAPGFYQNWPTIRRQLLEGTCEPGASRRKSIPKKDGGDRKKELTVLIQ